MPFQVPQIVINGKPTKDFGMVSRVSQCTSDEPVSPLAGCQYTEITIVFSTDRTTATYEETWRVPGYVSCERGSCNSRLHDAEMVSHEHLAGTPHPFPALVAGENIRAGDAVTTVNGKVYRVIIEP